jgi:hypothetical protein
VFVKPPEILSRDRLLGTYEVRPVLAKLRSTLVGSAGLLLAASLVLGGLIRAGSDADGVYGRGSTRAPRQVTANGVIYSKRVTDLSQLAAGAGPRGAVGGGGGCGLAEERPVPGRSRGCEAAPAPLARAPPTAHAARCPAPPPPHPYPPRPTDDELAAEEAAAMGGVPGYCSDRLLRAASGGMGCPDF